MTDFLVDSNVILDVLTEDPHWFDWSSAQLADCAQTGTLHINPIIYAEVSIGFKQVTEVESVLSSSFFQRDGLPYEAAFLAGQAFLQYRRRGGVRRSPLPDFYIGAHAKVCG
jgi:predicted nucleic acid-binding protein